MAKATEHSLDVLRWYISGAEVAAHSHRWCGVSAPHLKGAAGAVIVTDRKHLFAFPLVQDTYRNRRVERRCLPFVRNDFHATMKDKISGDRMQTGQD